MTLTTAKQAANAGVFSDDVLAVLRENGYTDEMLKAIYGYEPNSGGSGTITDASQLGAAALNIANAMSRVNSPSQLGTWAERISDALDDGKITEAEASSCWMQSAIKEAEHGEIICTGTAGTP